MTTTDADIKKLRTVFATKDELDEKLTGLGERFDNKLSNFRSELLEKLDRILKEIVASRQEETLSTLLRSD